MTSEPASRRRLALGMFVALQCEMHFLVLVVAALISNWQGGDEILDTEWFIELGICCGQTSLAAIWVGLGPRGFLVRTPPAILAWAMSLLWLTEPILNTRLNVWVALLAFFAAQFVLWQGPCWFARTYWNRQFGEPLCHERYPQRLGQFTLFQLLFWMAGCACLIGALRFLFRNFGPGAIVDLMESPGAVIEPAIIAAYPMLNCMGWSLPMICAVSTRRCMWIWILGLLVFIPVFTFAESLHSRCSIGSYVVFPFHQLLWLNATHAVWLTANLMLLWLAGYRLERTAKRTNSSG